MPCRIGVALAATISLYLPFLRSAGALEESTLSRADTEADLEQLYREMESRYSYWTRKGVDHAAEFGSVRKRLPETVPRAAFVLEVQRLLCLFGDGHSQVEQGDLRRALPPGYLPFLVGDAQGGLVGFDADRARLVAPECPFVEKLDGVAVEKWIEAAKGIVPRASDAFVRHHAVRNLRFVGFLRTQLRLEAKDALAVELRSADRKQTRQLAIPLASKPPVYGDWPRGESRMLDDQIGYLRLADMDDEPEFLEALRRTMDGYRATHGLVIDVRGNGGGSRDAVRTLFPYFLGTGDTPRVANVAAYRVPPGEERGRNEGYLADRFLYPISAEHWSQAERKAIAAVAARFRPEWTPPDGAFSDWHYLILGPSTEKETARYDKPVVVLMDDGCFSATDIFLAAFKGWKKVTLLGLPSGGGSGRARGLRLDRSGIELRLSSMVSFFPDGRLLEGRGVEPDVEVERLPGDWIGQSDAQLDAALAKLRGRTP